MNFLRAMLLLLVIAIPVAAYVAIPKFERTAYLEPPPSTGSVFPASPVSFQRSVVGPEPFGMPKITNVQIVDLNQDSQPEVIVCDAARNAVFSYSVSDDGSWSESLLADKLVAPAHATVVDIDADNDNDVLVSVLGNIEPDDGVIGRLVLLEATANGYEQHLLLDDVRRVADAQTGDFDSDGDLDIAVAVFGYNRGQVLWLENYGGFVFRPHELLSAPGTIHVPVGDYDNDGDLDIAAIVSQDEEELWAFENLGQGKFRNRQLYMTFNFDLGSAGLVNADLDSDGDLDLILPAGDNLEDMNAFPQPYHGCLWFENQGDWNFEEKRITEFGGTYAADVADMDNDGDQDVVLVSMSNDWHNPECASLVWLENDGQQTFTAWEIDRTPTHLVTVACGDLNGDGRTDVVAGGLHIRPPFQHLGRVTAWTVQESPEE